MSLSLLRKVLLASVSSFMVQSVVAEGLTPDRLGVIYDTGDAKSARVALYYAAQREIPKANVLGIHVPSVDSMAPESFIAVRQDLLNELPTSVQSLLLVWSRPYAVGCMSITTAFAAGYNPAFCTPGCVRTVSNPVYDSAGWLPADTNGWLPAMLLPSDDEALAHRVISRGVEADGSAPPGILYLAETTDWNRNRRALTYERVASLMQGRLRVAIGAAPDSGIIPDAIGYFTGAVRVAELTRIRFRPGAIADHLTSSGGVLDGDRQMSALWWLKQGAVASYGTVSEPCNYLEKFPNVGVLFEHYRHGETALESYWKSVAMPGQGLFIGEPLARPYANSIRRNPS